MATDSCRRRWAGDEHSDSSRDPICGRDDVRSSRDTISGCLLHSARWRRCESGSSTGRPDHSVQRPRESELGRD